MLALLVVLAFPVSGYCNAGTSTSAAATASAGASVSTSTELSSNQVEQLKGINTEIAVVQKLAQRKLIPDADATAAISALCKDAGAIVGHPVTVQDIQTLVAQADKTSGVNVFWIMLIVLAGLLILLGVVLLIGYYFGEILAQIPPVVYELAAYAATAALALSGYLLPSFHIGVVLVNPIWFSVVGAFALAGCIFLTHKLHFKAEKGKEDTVLVGPGFIDFPTVMFGVLTIAWAAMAVFYHRLFPDASIPYFYAFIAVMALQAFLGFSVITMPGCIAMGWDTDRKVPKSVLSSLIILVGYMYMKLTNQLTDDTALFQTGAMFMGAFVYYLGLLVMSSKYYLWSGRTDGKEHGRYIIMQIVTIASGVAALYFGSAYHMGTLLGVGGTFFAIYLLEKYYDLPWKGIGFAWSLVGAAGFLYFVVAFANNHPEYFIWGIR